MATKADVSKAQQERVQSLLIDTVTLLCKNSIQFQDELKVEGLLGITVDKEVFLVNINEKFQEEKEESEEEAPPETTPTRGAKRSHSDVNDGKDLSRVQVKQENQDDDDDEDLVIVKDEGVRERRVPPLHGTSDDMNYEGYPSPYAQRDSGEPPSKRRPMQSRAGPFHSGDSSHSSDGYSMANMAAQVSQNVMEGGGMWQPQPGPSGGGGGGAANMGAPGTGELYYCQVADCGKAYTTRNGLMYHAAAKHSGVSGYECLYDGCGKLYKYRHDLYKHLRMAHNVNTADYRLAKSYMKDLAREASLQADNV